MVNKKDLLTAIYNTIISWADYWLVKLSSTRVCVLYTVNNCANYVQFNICAI